MMASRRVNSGEQLSTVATLISEAQTLDANGDELGAYRHYLSCVAQMAQTLSGDIQANQGQGTLPEIRCVQLFKMARNCLDRGEKIYTTAKQEQRPLALFRLASPSPTVSPTLLTSPVDNGSFPRPLEKFNTWPHSLGPPQSSLVNTRAVVGREGRDGGEEQAPTKQTSRIQHQLSYIERAKLRNAHMMEQYKAVLRESRSTNNLPSDVRLSMLRRLDENVGVAKIKEQTIARKLREREFRLAQEAKGKSHVSLTILTIDELCDTITSYEHGKSATSNIKAKLNTAGSNADQIYSTVAEILGMSEHPLARLLAEGQYNVFMMLQPLVSAIEKAGGLPYLEIRLDNCSLDRKPSDDAPKNTADSIPAVKSSVVEEHQDDDDDDLLDLLTEDDEDLLDELTTPHSAKTSHSEPLYHVLESPNEHRTESLYQDLESSTQTAGNLYQDLEPSTQAAGSFDFTSNAAYGTVKKLNEEEEPRYVSRDHMTSSGEAVYTNSHQEQSQQFYSVPPSKSPLYEKLDDLNVNSHLYEPLDCVETTDGGLLSRPVEPVFHNLPPLVCAAHYGDESSLNKLSTTAESVVKEAVKSIRKLLDTLEEVFGKCYPVLSSGDNAEVVASVLEANFFPGILQPLTLVYRCKNYREECSTATNMCQNVNATPKDLAVRDKYWLIQQTYAPYGEAIDELRGVPSHTSPTPKLNGLVRLSKRIIQCITDYHQAQGNTAVDTAVGVDDLLPILSYVIVRSGLPQLVSEAAIMEEFIGEGYMRGEEGFCLTSFMTALKFVAHMSS